MEAAPLFEDVAGGPPDGVAHWCRAPDGLRLRIAHWRPETARGTILLFPGRTEYVEKYGPAADILARAGLATIAIDWRGQGLSDRLLDDRLGGHVMAFSDYQMDVDALLAAASELDLPRPYFLLGHSMGGAIGLRALHAGLDVAACAFSSPMWGISLSATLRPLAWTLSWSARRIGLGHRYAPGTSRGSYPNTVPFAENLLTDDPDQLAWLARQTELHPDLALGGPSLRWLHEALSETRALDRIPSPDLPCLTFFGTDEKIVDLDRIERRMARWTGGELLRIEGGRHETLFETPDRRRRAFDALTAHFEAYLPAV
ncbi:lysophospholipase [Palleronia aestuarii]|uniref:Lysophospholipase n=1 Tax=Palleronia aestuarii TaxID=568105 RepID=A0A2W7Q2S1_9RHOB|nr:alpha/beta hydrolase [Palleronia aestuarii]PZX16039.1 lysophospholipase [Palleronia aestuarii]